MTILGAVGAYLKFQHYAQSRAVGRPAGEPEQRAVGKFSLELTLTFNAGGDNAFALEPTTSTAVLVQLRGRDVLRIEDPVAAGMPITVDDAPDIVVGANEFYVEAHPSNDALSRANAVRVRILRDGHPAAEQTLWSEPGLPVRGTVRVHVESSGLQAHEH